MPSIPKDYKAGYAAIIGLPNAGKSTLLNALLNIKLSIISPKPQTTRRRVLGILNKDNYQVVFIDTPGILKPRYELQKKMMTQVTESLEDADIIIGTFYTERYGVDALKNATNQWKFFQYTAQSDLQCHQQVQIQSTGGQILFTDSGQRQRGAVQDNFIIGYLTVLQAGLDFHRAVTKALIVPLLQI